MLLDSQKNFSGDRLEWGEEASPFMADDRPTMVIMGSERGRGWLRRIAERSGLRPVERPAISGLRSCSPDVMLLDLRGEEGIGWLRESRRKGDDLSCRQLSVLVDLDGLDEALALLSHLEPAILCEPSDSEIISAMVLAGLRGASHGPRRLHDVTHEAESGRLEKLSEEVRRLASTIERLTTPNRALLSPGAADKESGRSARLARLEAAEPACSPATAPVARSPGGVPIEGMPEQADIRALIRARRLRDQFLPPDLFADPAWDMLLDLLAARLAGRRVSVSSLCIAAAVPPTTALRWIRQLTEREIFVRVDDPLDGRRVFIDLTDQTAEALLGWVRAVRRKGGLLAPTR